MKVTLQYIKELITLKKHPQYDYLTPFVAPSIHAYKNIVAERLSKSKIFGKFASLGH